MMNDLDTLRPEVAEAIRLFGAVIEELGLHDDYESALHVLSAELLRLADECATLKAQSIHPRAQLLIMLGHANDRAEKAEAELAALKARMKPCAQVVGGEVRALMDPDDEGKYVAVLVVEE